MRIDRTLAVRASDVSTKGRWVFSSKQVDRVFSLGHHMSVAGAGAL